MITPEQANLLTAEGLLSFQRGQMGWEPKLATLIEFIVMARALLDKSLLNGREMSPWKMTSERYRYLMEAGGVLNLALQHHGAAEHNLHQLRRALHPQQADKKSELLQDQLMRKECADKFKEVFNAACHNQPLDVDAWERLKGTLERLGVQF
jgi:hypothetical protein